MDQARISNTRAQKYSIQMMVFSLLLVFGLLLAIMMTVTTRLTSPDEALNALFAKRVVQGQSLAIPTSLSAEQLAAFSPRSVAVRGTKMLPGSFVGFDLVIGHIEARLGTNGPAIVLALLAALAAGCWFLIVRRYWEPSWAWLSVLLLIFHPAFLQFMTLPYFHAGWFTALLMMTGYALLRYQEKPHWQTAIWVGLAAGAALFIRPSEVLWVGPAIGVVMIARPRGWLWLLITAPIVLAMQIPWLVIDHHLYGSFFASAYTPNGLDAVATAGSASWLSLLTPAGGKWSWVFWRHVWDFVVLQFPVYSVLTAVTLVVYFRRKFFSWLKVLKIGSIIFLTMYVLAYYGTWELYPHVTAAQVGTLASYIRYWLPLVVAMSAGVIVALRGVAHMSVRMATVVVALVVVGNVLVAVFHPASGWQQRRRDNQQESARVRAVLPYVPPNGFLFAGNDDKLFVAKRTVSYAYPVTSDDWRLAAEMVQARPVFVLADPRAMSLTSLADQASRAGLLLQSLTTIQGDRLFALKTL